MLLCEVTDSPRAKSMQKLKQSISAFTCLRPNSSLNHRYQRFCTIGLQQRNAGLFTLSVCALPYGQVLQPNLEMPSSRFLYISCTIPACSRRRCL